MGKYELSTEAENDLFNIALYGLENYGLSRSELFRDQLKERFQLLADDPQRYPAVDNIAEGYRRSVYRTHSIYYQIKPNYVEIVRIINRQNLEFP
jgi:toxin ParE1/3/4